jgi:predicted RNase H-like HicB family nuclease
MRNEFTAIVERDGPWYVAYCAEVPGANGQGETREECLANLRQAIALIFEHSGKRSLRPGQRPAPRDPAAASGVKGMSQE